jgi:hypothetical protein
VAWIICLFLERLHVEWVYSSLKNLDTRLCRRFITYNHSVNSISAKNLEKRYPSSHPQRDLGITMNSHTQVEPGYGHGMEMELEPGSALDETQHPRFSLAPADTGKEAWGFLAAAFMMEIMIWGKCSQIVWALCANIFRISLVIRYLSGLLFHYSTVRWIHWHPRNRYLGDGNAVHYGATHIRNTHAVPQAQTPSYSSWVIHHVPFAGIELLLQNSAPIDPYPRHSLRHWRSRDVQSCNHILGRMVCPPKRSCVWDHVGWHRSWRCHHSAPPPVSAQPLWLSDYTSHLDCSALCHHPASDLVLEATPSITGDQPRQGRHEVSQERNILASSSWEHLPGSWLLRAVDLLNHIYSTAWL